METLQDILNNFINKSDFKTDNSVDKTRRRKKVYQFDRDGKLFSDYKSILEASKKMNIPDELISSALRSKSKFSQGYFWSTNPNQKFDISGNYQHNRGYLVYDVKGLFIEKFRTQQQIKEKYNLNASSLSQVLKGKRPHTKGFVIKYEK